MGRRTAIKCEDRDPRAERSPKAKGRITDFLPRESSGGVFHSGTRFSDFVSRIACALLVVLAASAVAADTNAFQRQMITLPAINMPTRFVDLGHTGRADLLALDPAAKRLLIYRQRASGFADAPDQTIELPPQTFWIAPYLVEDRTHFDLLMSTATGLVCYRQKGGVFESEPRVLIKAYQIFTNDDVPGLISLGSNAAIPVFAADSVRMYQQNEASSWTSGPPILLENETKPLGQPRQLMDPGRRFSSQPHYFTIASPGAGGRRRRKAREPNHREMMTEMKKGGAWYQPHIIRVDLEPEWPKGFHSLAGCPRLLPDGSLCFSSRSGWQTAGAAHAGPALPRGSDPGRFHTYDASPHGRP
jgi:hypothetical protein